MNHSIGRYREVASAPAVWAHQLRPTVAGRSAAEVGDHLADLAARRNLPITALALGTAESVSALILLRDPSRTHGTPEPRAYAAAAADLACTPGWRDDGPVQRSPVMVVLGLREGFQPGARVHDADWVRQWQRYHFGVSATHAGELLSYRPLPDGTVRPHREPGVITYVTPEQLPLMAALADEMRQERFVVHDVLAGRTYALHHAGGETA